MLSEAVSEKLNKLDLTDAMLESFASNLIWRIGRLSEDMPVTIRVGLATNAMLFEELPKLKNLSNDELEQAISNDNFKVEWVGQVP